MDLQLLSTNPNAAVELQFIPKVKQKISKIQFEMKKFFVKGVTAKATRMAHREVKKVIQLKVPEPAAAAEAPK